MNLFGLLGAIFAGGFLAGICFWGYLAYRYFMLELGFMARKHEPVKRYLISCLMVVVWGVGTWLLVVIIMQFDGYGAIPLFLLGVFGFGGWMFVLIRWMIRRGEYHQWLQARNDPPMQMWMQDLITAVLVYGALLAFMQKVNIGLEIAELIALAIYLFSCTGLGMYAALDVARYSRALQRPGLRAALVLFSIAYTLIFSVVTAWAAWRGWRLSRWWSWDRLKRYEVLEAERQAVLSPPRY